MTIPDSPLTEAARALGRKGGGRKTDAQRAELDAGRNGYNAARTAANIARARVWLDEVDSDIPEKRITIMKRHHAKTTENYFMKSFSREYATLHNIHPRTAARHLLAAMAEKGE